MQPTAKVSGLISWAGSARVLMGRDGCSACAVNYRSKHIIKSGVASIILHAQLNLRYQSVYGNICDNFRIWSFDVQRKLNEPWEIFMKIVIIHIGKSVTTSLIINIQLLAWSQIVQVNIRNNFPAWMMCVQWTPGSLGDKGIEIHELDLLPAHELCISWIDVVRFLYKKVPSYAAYYK